jgi:hypothetical protein
LGVTKVEEEYHIESKYHVEKSKMLTKENQIEEELESLLEENRVLRIIQRQQKNPCID